MAGHAGKLINFRRRTHVDGPGWADIGAFATTIAEMFNYINSLAELHPESA